MKEYDEQFIYLLNCYINKVSPKPNYNFDIKNVFRLAEIHNVVPMIYSSASKTSCDVTFYKKKAIKLISFQLQKNASFCKLYGLLLENNIKPIVVKGPVCAELYPDFDYRISSDFDIIISESEKNKVADFLLSLGFSEKGESYISDEWCLYIEVHTSLSEENGKIENYANKIFFECMQNIDDSEEYATLSVDDNLTYLLYHAFKHFTGSGFGVRQIIDIALFTEKNKNLISFKKVMEKLSLINADIFAYNVYYVAEKCFGFDFSNILKELKTELIVFDELISDVLCAGVFGKSSENRLHSAAIVKEAVAGNENNKLIKTLFPNYSVMKNKYNILKYLPFLLPLFWFLRVVTYLLKIPKKNKGVSPKETLSIATDRITLMKKMNIIK